MSNRISVPRFCKLVGVSTETGRQWVKKGYIVKGGDGKIDPFEAARSLRANIPPNEMVADLTPFLSEEGSDAPDYTNSRAKREHYQAELARLDFEQRSGELVEASWVEAIIVGACTELRVTLELMPDSLALELATQDDEAECRAILTQALEQAAGQFEASLRKIDEQPS
jgi:phage terminase Nu1 subunit (DNA packaging protein)